MIRNIHNKQQICLKHNLPLELLNPDKSNTNDLYICNQCIIEYDHPISIKQIQQQSNQCIIKQFEQQLDQNSMIWNICIHSLTSLRETFTNSIKFFENIIDVIRNQQQQTTNELKNINLNQKEGIKQAHESYLQIQLNLKKNIIQQIEVVKQNIQIDKLIQGLNEINFQQLNYDDQKYKINNAEIQQKQDIDQVVHLNFGELKKYEYQLIPESSIKQEEPCYALAFNYDGSIVVAGCDWIIQVFEFKNKQLKKVQSLESHYDLVTCLKFMKKSNQFICGSYDNKIKIWQVSNKNQYFNIQTLQKHSGWINCLIINSNDDLIVSGSDDKSIIFWGLNGKKWQLNYSIGCFSLVNGLSFNDSNTKLISCECNNYIQVFEQQGEKWIISQNIQVEKFGLRLCFISEDQFVFLPQKGKQLHFYKFDLQNNKFEKQMEVEVNNSNFDNAGFPIKFIRSKNLLIVKNCQFIHIIKKYGEENCIIDHFTSDLFGDVSEDGNFMITWDLDTEEYQLRYFNEIQ